VYNISITSRLKVEIASVLLVSKRSDRRTYPQPMGRPCTRGSSYYTERSFLIRLNIRQHPRTHALLMSNSSDEYSRYLAILRRRLTSNDALTFQNVRNCIAFALS
jgi:hypothetical protein